MKFLLAEHVTTGNKLVVRQDIDFRSLIDLSVKDLISFQAHLTGDSPFTYLLILEDKYKAKFEPYGDYINYYFDKEDRKSADNLVRYLNTQLTKFINRVGE